MALKGQSRSKSATQIFSRDLYDYIWSHQKFLRKGVDNEVDINRSEDVYYTENIGKAVRVSMFLLHDYFSNLFLFTYPNTFRQDFNLIWNKWIENRKNIFVKTVDTLAITAEAFIYSSKHKTFCLDLEDVNEWFVDLFEKNLADELYRNGGWKQLDKVCCDWYGALFQSLNENNRLKIPLEILKIQLDCCDLINRIRTSAMEFPIPKVMFCKNCFSLSDEKNTKNTTYIRIKKEILQAFRLANNNVNKMGALFEQIFEIFFSESEKNTKLQSMNLFKKHISIKQNSQFYPVGKLFIGEFPVIDTEPPNVTQLQTVSKEFLSSASSNADVINKTSTADFMTKIPPFGRVFAPDMSRESLFSQAFIGHYSSEGNNYFGSGLNSRSKPSNSSQLENTSENENIFIESSAKTDMFRNVNEFLNTDPGKRNRGFFLISHEYSNDFNKLVEDVFHNTLEPALDKPSVASLDTLFSNLSFDDNVKKSKYINAVPNNTSHISEINQKQNFLIDTDNFVIVGWEIPYVSICNRSSSQTNIGSKRKLSNS